MGGAGEVGRGVGRRGQRKSRPFGAGRWTLTLVAAGEEGLQDDAAGRESRNATRWFKRGGNRPREEKLLTWGHTANNGRQRQDKKCPGFLPLWPQEERES